MYYFPIVFLALSIDWETVLGSNALTDLMPAAVLALGIARFMSSERPALYVGNHWDKKNVAIYLLSLLVFVIGVMRINAAGTPMLSLASMTLKFALFPFFVYFFVSYQFKHSENFNLALDRLCYIVMLTITIEAAFYLLIYVGFYNRALVDTETSDPNLLLSLMGIYFEKRLMPVFDAHPNTMGIYIGGGVVMAALLLLQKSLAPSLRTLLLVSVGIGGLFLILVDSRGTAGNTVLATAGVWFLSKGRFLRPLRFFPLLTPLLPFILLATLAFVAQTGVGSQVSRQENDLATGNNRSAIWDECVKELSEPKIQHFFGYGAMGQYAAGVSQRYSWIFGGKDADKLVTHNYFFQQVFDVGYFGVLVFLALMVTVMTNAIKAYQRGMKKALAVIGFLMYFMLTGTTESVYGIYNKTYFMIFTTVVILMILSYNELNRQRAGKSADQGNEEPKRMAYGGGYSK